MFKLIKAIAISFTILFPCLGYNQNSNNPVNEGKTNAYLFVGTYTEGKSDSGIYIYKFNPVNGKLKKVVVAKNVINPSFLTVSEDGHYIYSCTESKIKNGGSISSFLFNDKNSTISFINKQPSMGENPVYVSLFKNSKWLVNGNYNGGNVSLYPVSGDGSLSPSKQVLQYSDSSILKERQSSSHIHATVFSPQYDYVFITDLGADKIRIYKTDSVNLNIAHIESISTKPGSGPRHLTFHPNAKFAYVVEELSETVSAYDYYNGSLKLKQRISTRDTIKHISYGSADIHVSPDGKFLYASNRGDKNTITIFSIDKDGTLKTCGYQSTLGTHPRNFTIDPTGNYLLVANLGTNNIVVFKRNSETGLLTETGIQINIPRPSCLVIRQIQSEKE